MAVSRHQTDTIEKTVTKNFYEDLITGLQSIRIAPFYYYHSHIYFLLS